MSTLTDNRKRQLIYLAGFLYTLSLHKYVHRDPLDPGSGIQGYLEAALICSAFACVFLATRGARRQYAPTLAFLSFTLFGILAFVSSFRSFNRTLSFGQAVLFFAILGIGYLTSQAGLVTRVFQSIYWTFTASLAFGLLLGVTLPNRFPLWSSNEYDGRTRLSVFQTFPGTMGETAAYLILLSPILFQRSHWISRFFLLFMNFAAGGKTSTAVLLLLLVVEYFSKIQIKRFAVLSFGVAVTLSLALFFTFMRGIDVSKSIGNSLSTIYGHEVEDEAVGLDGRMDLWRGSIPLITNSLIVGYGFGGARDILIGIAEWSGSSHNGFLELGLAGGIFGMGIFVIGLASVMRCCLRSPPDHRRQSFLVFTYMLIVALTGLTFNFPSYFGFLILILLLYLGMQPHAKRLSRPRSIRIFSPVMPFGETR